MELKSLVFAIFSLLAVFGSIESKPRGSFRGSSFGRGSSISRSPSHGSTIHRSPSHNTGSFLNSERSHVLNTGKINSPFRPFAEVPRVGPGSRIGENRPPSPGFITPGAGRPPTRPFVPVPGVGPGSRIGENRPPSPGFITPGAGRPPTRPFVPVPGVGPAAGLSPGSYPRPNYGFNVSTGFAHPPPPLGFNLSQPFPPNRYPILPGPGGSRVNYSLPSSHNVPLIYPLTPVQSPNVVHHSQPSIIPVRSPNININIPNVVPNYQPGRTIVVDPGTYNGPRYYPVHQRHYARNSGSTRFSLPSPGFNLQHIVVVLVILFSATWNPYIFPSS